MITELNLATRPFRNRTTPYLLALLVLLLAFFAGIYCLVKYSQEKKQLTLAQEQGKAMKAELAVFKENESKIQQQLTPQQSSLLIASHMLVANKSFGWSRLFADLEGVIPGSVSASRINVENIFRDGDRVKADLEFTVLSRDYESVVAMINAMNNSGMFQAELRSQSRQKAETFVYSEYTLRLLYTQAYGNTPANDLAQSQSGGEQ